MASSDRDVFPELCSARRQWTGVRLLGAMDCDACNAASSTGAVTGGAGVSDDTT